MNKETSMPVEKPVTTEELLWELLEASHEISVASENVIRIANADPTISNNFGRSDEVLDLRNALVEIKNNIIVVENNQTAFVSLFREKVGQNIRL